MRELALFAGAGGGILGGHLLGWRTICAVEWADYPRRVLMQRQDDGVLPAFPIWDDVQTFDGRPWAGLVDVVSGGFPCQDISAAGKGAGIDGERSGMWSHMARIIGEVQPQFVFVENSPVLTSRGLGRVLGDLAEMGFDAEWCVLGADDVGAPHRRDRIWILGVLADAVPTWKRGELWQGEAEANATFDPSRIDCHARRAEPARQLGTAWLADGGDDVAYTNGLRELQQEGRKCEKWRRPSYASWWSIEPRLGRVAHGVANRMGRLTAIGNGQVPAVAASAFRILTERAGWSV